MERDLWSTLVFEGDFGSRTGPITTGEDESHEIPIPLDASEFFDFGSFPAGSQIHEPCSPPQTQPGDQHHEEEPAPEPARDEDIIELAGDKCMQSTLSRPTLPKDKGTCDQSRTKNEPSRYEGRRGRSGEGIIREKIPRSPRKRLRSNNWHHEEVVSLLKVKLSLSNSVNRITDWSVISRKLKEDYSITRSAEECAGQWGSGKKRCRKLTGELESSNIDEGTFWENRKHKTFNLECYKMMLPFQSKGAEIDRVKKQKVHEPQASPASTSRAPRASTMSTSEIMGNSEGHGTEQRPGSSTQLDNPTDDLVRLLAGGDQDLTNKQMVDVKKEFTKLHEIQMLGMLVALKGREYKSKETECEFKRIEWELKKNERERIKLELEELESKMQELQVEL